MANNKPLLIRRNTTLIIVSCIIALSIAYISEHVFKIEPCILCIFQRLPYFIVIIVALFIWSYPTKIHFVKALIYFCAFTFLVGTLLALFHVGVEKGFIKDPVTCSVKTEESFQTIEQLKQSMLNSGTTNMPRCSEVQFAIFGISMAGFNFMYSLILTAYCLLFSYHLKHTSKHLF